MNQLLKNIPEKRAAIYIVPVKEILDLRQRILRASLPPETSRFQGDEWKHTWHFALYHPTPPENAPIVCCASFMFEPYNRSAAWRLRGMATDSKHQDAGFGTLLLETAEKAIFADSGTGVFWCNARIPAIGFYQKQGWKIDSEEFTIPEAGPHRKMVKRLS